MAQVTEINVNGTRRRVNAGPERSLLSVLRDDLDLTGAKYGCGEGQCGACTVLLDGSPVRSCITRVVDTAGKAITTIEGLERNGRLHPLQEAFLEPDAMQCGRNRRDAMRLLYHRDDLERRRAAAQDNQPHRR